MAANESFVFPFHWLDHQITLLSAILGEFSSFNSFVNDSLVTFAGWSQDGEINTACLLGPCRENRAHGDGWDTLEWAPGCPSRSGMGYL